MTLQRYGIDSRDNRISPLVLRQVPSFVRDFHPKFITFLEKYFDYVERESNEYGEGGPFWALRSLLDFQDIDLTEDSLLVQFHKELAKTIPQNILTDKRTLYKNILDLYEAKGTEKSYEFLFRILFRDKLTFYYPHVDIFKPSDGVWVVEKTIRIFNIKGDPFQFIGKVIVGVDSGTRAGVDKVLRYQIGIFSVYELFLNSKTIEGPGFSLNEVVRTEDGSIEGQLYTCVTGVIITNPGSGYVGGEQLSLSGGSGIGASLVVNSVGPNGEVKSVSIVNPGVNYTTVPNLTFPTTGNTATGEAVNGVLVTYPGFYLNENGFLSTTKFLQDSFFFQQFSYVLRSNQSINVYRDVVKQSLHPAGLIMFGSVFDVSFARDVAVYHPTGGLNSLVEVHDFQVSPDPIKEIYWKTLIDHIVPMIDESSFYQIGPTNESLDKYKFSALPHDPFFNPARKLAGCKFWTHTNAGLVTDPQNRISEWKSQSLHSTGGWVNTTSDTSRPLLTRDDNLENLIKRSGVYDQGGWVPVGVDVDDYFETDSQGDPKAARMTIIAGTSVHQIAQNTIVSSGSLAEAGNTYNLYFDVKKSAVARYIYVGDTADASPHSATFDFNTTPVVTGSSNTITESVTDLGNDWYRLMIQFTRTNSGTFEFTLAINSTGHTATPQSWNGAGTEIIFFSRAQCRSIEADDEYLQTFEGPELRGFLGNRMVWFDGVDDYLETEEALSEVIDGDIGNIYVAFKARSINTDAGRVIDNEAILQDLNKTLGLFVKSSGEAIFLHRQEVIFPSPATVPGLVAWFDAEDNVTIDGSNGVSLWGDKSSNGLDATDADTTAHRPVLTRSDNRENSIKYSEEFTQSVWNKTTHPVTAVDNETTDAYGSATAGSITASSGTSRHGIFIDASSSNGRLIVASNSYVIEVELKKSNYTYAWVGDGNDSSWHGITIDLDTGSFVGGGVNLTDKTIVSTGNGWWKITLTMTCLTSHIVVPGVWFGRNLDDLSPPSLALVGTEKLLLARAAARLASSDSTYVKTTTFFQLPGVNDHKALYFDGVGTHLRINSIASLFSGTDPDLSIFAVIKTFGGSGNNTWFSFGNTSGATPYYTMRDDGVNYSVITRDDASLTKTASFGSVDRHQTHIVAHTNSGVVGNTYLDGTLISTANYDFDVGARTLNEGAIGAFRRGNAFTSPGYHHGYILAIVILDHEATLSERVTITDYLTARFITPTDDGDEVSQPYNAGEICVAVLRHREGNIEFQHNQTYPNQLTTSGNTADLSGALRLGWSLGSAQSGGGSSSGGFFPGGFTGEGYFGGLFPEDGDGGGGASNIYSQISVGEVIICDRNTPKEIEDELFGSLHKKWLGIPYRRQSHWMSPPNETYWDTYGNFQLKDRGDIVISDLSVHRKKKTKFSFDPYVRAKEKISEYPEITFDLNPKYEILRSISDTDKVDWIKESRLNALRFEPADFNPLKRPSLNLSDPDFRGMPSMAFSDFSGNQLVSLSALENFIVNDEFHGRIIFIAEDVDQSKGILISDGLSPYNFDLYVEDGFLKFEIVDFGDPVIISQAISSNTAYVASFSLIGGTMSLSLNGGSPVTESATHVDQLGTMVSIGGQFSDFFNGRIARIILANADADFSVMDDILISKYLP